MNNIKKLISKPLFLPIFCMLLVMAVNIIYDVASGNFAFNFFTISIRNGMTIFLVISTIYPNGHYLRPTTFARDNVFVHMVKCLYATDTATNLFPSIHVYNSIAVNLAVWHSENFRDKKVIRIGSAVLMVSIILSTMFLKQHSVFDVVTGIIMAVFMYMLVYVQNPARMTAGERKYERKLHQI